MSEQGSGFNPFSMERLPAPAAAKSEVRVDE